MKVSRESMLPEIEKLRTKMAVLAKNKGYTHGDTVKISQQLDRLLNKYTHFRCKE